MKPLPVQFDPSVSDILFYWQESSGKYVKLVRPLEADNDDGDSEACDLWREKYGEEMPDDAYEYVPEGVVANFIDYDGSTTFTDVEKEHMRQIIDAGSGLTLDVLWFVVEGLGWRPLSQPSEDDPGWADVFAKEDDCIGYAMVVAELVFEPAPTEVLDAKLGRLAERHAPGVPGIFYGSADRH